MKDRPGCLERLGVGLAATDRECAETHERPAVGDRRDHRVNVLVGHERGANPYRVGGCFQAHVADPGPGLGKW